MSKDQINQFDATAGNNTDVEGINTSETMVPSAVNNALRSLMSLLKKQEVGTHAMTSPDINGGTIDGATIATSNVTVGSGKTLDVSAGTLTLANDQISGDKINGGSISATFVGNLTGNVTGNVSGTAATVTGAAQSAITSVGTLTSFRSTGIDDNADSTAITIDSSERVGISTTTPDTESLVDLGPGENTGFTRKLNIVNVGNSRAGLGALSNILRIYYADDQKISFGSVSRDGNYTFAEKAALDASGNLSLTGNLDIPDSSKIRIGNSDDLTLHHDGSNSYISDTGTGNLYVLASVFAVNNAANSAAQIIANDGGAVELYHNGARKFNTESTGATLTGKLVSSVNGENFISKTTSQYGGLAFQNSSGTREGLIDYDHTEGVLGIKAHTANHYMTFQTGGYNDRFLIAADGKIGISEASPDSLLHMTSSSDELRIENTGTAQWNSARIRLQGPGSSNRSTQIIHGNTAADSGDSTRFAVELANASGSWIQTMVQYDYTSRFWAFTTGSGAGSEALRIDSSQRVGIKTTSPSTELHVNGYITASKGTVQTVTATPNTHASANSVNAWAEINSNYRVGITLKHSNSRVLGTFHIPMNPTGAANILFFITPWYSTDGGSTKTVISQGIGRTNSLNNTVAPTRSANGYDANDMQNHVVHFHHDPGTTSALTYGWYLRSEGGNTVYVNHSNTDNANWGFTAPMYLELREIRT